MEKKIALAISILFHPLLMPSYLLGIVLLIVPEYYSPLNSEQAFEIIIRLAPVTVVLPILSISILKFTGQISSFQLQERKERILPYSFTAIYYGVLAYIFMKSATFHSLFILMSSMTALVLIVALINMFIKTSAHAAACASVIGFLAALKLVAPDTQLLYVFCGSVIVAGIIMTSRLSLNAHKPSEIYSGALVGFAIGFSGVYFLY